jgi:hypothetical protein
LEHGFVSAAGTLPHCGQNDSHLSIFFNNIDAHCPARTAIAAEKIIIFTLKIAPALSFKRALPWKP